jgi:hypothetical protein
VYRRANIECIAYSCSILVVQMGHQCRTVRGPLGMYVAIDMLVSECVLPVTPSLAQYCSHVDSGSRYAHPVCHSAGCFACRFTRPQTYLISLSADIIARTHRLDHRSCCVHVVSSSHIPILTFHITTASEPGLSLWLPTPARHRAPTLLTFF